MYPTRLNLLSPAKKKNLERIILFQFMRSLFELCLIIVCLCATLIVGSHYLLEQFYHRITNSVSPIGNHYAKVNQKIKEINTILKDAEAIQKEYILWTPLIEEVTRAIPLRIRVTNLDFRGDEHVINISGQAETRDDLLLLQKQLEAITCNHTCTVQAPLLPGQLTKKETIAFTLSASVTPL